MFRTRTYREDDDDQRVRTAMMVQIRYLPAQCTAAALPYRAVRLELQKSTPARNLLFRSRSCTAFCDATVPNQDQLLLRSLDRDAACVFSLCPSVWLCASGWGRSWRYKHFGCYKFFEATIRVRATL